MGKREFVDWEEFEKFKRNISYLKRVECSAKTSCIFWREGDFCVSPDSLMVGGMGTCLSMEPPDDFGEI